MYGIKSLIGILLVTCSMQVLAVEEVDKRIVCADTNLVLGQLLQGEYKEVINWIGMDDSKSKFMLLTNPKTGTWTFLQFDKDRACGLASGIMFNNILSGNII